MGYITYGIIAALVVVVGLGIWGAMNYAKTFYAEKQVILTVSRIWEDTEPVGTGESRTIKTYYLVGGKDQTGQDRVIEIVTFKNKNVDVVYGSLKVGEKYNFVCYGEENLSINYYYQCTTI